MCWDLHKMSGIVFALTQNVSGFAQEVRDCFLIRHNMCLDFHKMSRIVSDLGEMSGIVSDFTQKSFWIYTTCPGWFLFELT